MIRIRSIIVGLLIVTAGFAVGCSSKNEGKTPDGGGSGSGSGSNSNCTSLATGTPYRTASSDNMTSVWRGDVSSDLGGGAGSTTTMSFEFYAGIETSLVGSLDLSMGNQNNYKTCAACIRVVTADSTGMTIVKQYFQSGGTLTLSADPFSSRHMMGTVKNLVLDEVTVDTTDFTSTPVAGGVCLTLPDMTLDAGAAPASWTCADGAYGDGGACDCACGGHDPDCNTAGATVAGCTAAQTCASDDTCVNTCHVLAPAMGCTTGTCGFENATLDICYADPAAVSGVSLGATCAAGPTFCGVANTIAKGLCDTSGVDDLKCRAACAANTDCAGTEVCQPIVGTRGLCVPKITNDTCPSATALTVGTAVTGTTAGATNDYDKGLEIATCTKFAQAGRDVAYSVNLVANTAYTVTVSGVSADFDPSAALLGPAVTSCGIGGPTVMSTCVKGADAGAAGAGETFAYTPTTTGVYYVVVDSFYASTGTYTLKVTSP